MNGELKAGDFKLVKEPRAAIAAALGEAPAGGESEKKEELKYTQAIELTSNFAMTPASAAAPAADKPAGEGEAAPAADKPAGDAPEQLAQLPAKTIILGYQTDKGRPFWFADDADEAKIAELLKETKAVYAVLPKGGTSRAEVLV